MTRTALERVGAQVAWAVGLAVVGAAVGLGVGLVTPTHQQIAGTDATIRIEVGKRYDEFEFVGLLSGRRAAARSLLGEPLGVSVRLDLDTSTFLNIDGSFNPRVLPAYIQTYSNPEQLGRDLGHAVALHLLRWVAAGAAAGVLTLLLRRGYVGWRHRQDTHLAEGRQLRDAALAYRAPERRMAVRVVLAGFVLVSVALVPGSGRQAPPASAITPTPLLDGTPLAGAEVGGPLLPAFNAAEAYIRRYFADTNTYYAQLRSALLERLATDPLVLPTGKDVVNVGFVTDRHCNTGMDRVIVALLKSVDARVLVSAGDDSFSGTFAFESACTAGLASASHHNHIKDVFVAGNHDSSLTLDAEKDQGIKVLNNKLVTVEGLTFAGLPDPRTSRYGEGLQPSSRAEQEQVLTAQGEQTGALACNADGPVVVVLHDVYAGRKALESGCGKAVLALSGHTHMQEGPDLVPLPDGGTGYSYVGASTGGAPTDTTIEHSFASSLTVGPLNHTATINIVSIDRTTGALVEVTECHIEPDQTITFQQQPVTT